jgi:hypothetical protein
VFPLLALRYPVRPVLPGLQLRRQLHQCLRVPRFQRVLPFRRVHRFQRVRVLRFRRVPRFLRVRVHRFRLAVRRACRWGRP